MTSLRDIRRRIQSVINVQQITKAMEMVAAARLRKAQAKAERSHRYSLEMDRILSNLIASSPDARHPLFIPRPIKKVGVVIISGDRGLCGAYHTNLFSYAEKFLKNYPKDKIELILVGKKAISAFAKKGYTIRQKVPDWGGKINLDGIEKLSNEWVRSYLSGELDEIRILYTHFINVLSRKIVEEKFLSLSRDAASSAPINYIQETAPEELYQQFLPFYLKSKVQTILDDAYAAELAARTFSMRQATNNAKEMLEQLILERNKIRQTGITREMIEITAGAQGV